MEGKIFEMLILASESLCAIVITRIPGIMKGLTYLTYEF